MNYIHPNLLSNHWKDLVSMIKENYYNDYYNNDLIIIGYCCFSNLDEIKKNYPQFERYIVYQLEPLTENHWHSSEKIISNIRNADEIWDYDLDNIEYLKLNGIEAKYKPFVYTEKLKRIENSKSPDIDVLFYGSLVKRRADIITHLTGNGLAGNNFVYVTQCDGDKLDEYISRSKIILDLHTDENKIQKQSRIYYSLINNKCVVSEKSKRNYFGDLIIEAETDNLIQTIEETLKNENWKTHSNNISERYREYSKKKKMKNTNSKIVMISMFKNEATTIRRMLESCYYYIDYWILQDNGSTDGTPDIVKDFFKDKNIPGFIYQVKEGWVSFGWNRDHLLQKCLKTDHGCDWIMKMDCDEYLEVDDDFDWSPFDNKDIQSFHVTAQNPGCIYYRAWIWNAKLSWKFKHDVAHECIYLDNEIGENFERVNLHRGLRMIGTADGESYTVRTKYISDGLKLEEQLIREETMLTDTYHFWYVAKSYDDCYRGTFYPLKEEHSKEFARRAIFYYKEYLKFIGPQTINEMAYFSAFSIGVAYHFLQENETAIKWLNDAEQYCPVRNEHIAYLAEIYKELGQYEKMLDQTKRLVHPDRKLPFPEYYFIIDTNLYQDSGTIPQQLHDYALSKVKEEKTINSFSINIQTKPRLWIVDNFYDDPYAVREFAMKQEFEENLDYYKGNRSKQQFIVPGTKEAFEKIIGHKITNWTETHGMCGRFQYCTAQDDLVYHCDSQTLAGMIYLTPDAPFSCGTSLFAHKDSKLRNENDFGNLDVFGQTGFYDRSKFELVDTAGNVFNRLVLFDAKCIHSANEYFGTNITNCRLFHLFFFD